MPPNREINLGTKLADNRRNGTISPLPLKQISSQEQAEGVQWEANFALGDQIVGYVMSATTAAAQRRLGCDGPIFGRAFASSVIPSGSVVPLPEGILGAGCGWAFTLGLPYPQLGQPICRDTLEPFIVGCATTIELMGRRVPGDVPLNPWTVTADYALHVASVVSPLQPDWRSVDLASCDVSLALDDQVLAQGRGRDLLGHPLEPLVQLAEALQARGQGLNAFDRIFVGSCTTLLQVLPGQRVRAAFSALAGVNATLA